jgi:hypothetical protein
MKSIYEITVPVTSQEQADRLKDICVKYGLPIWDYKRAFTLDEWCRYFLFDTRNTGFAVFGHHLNKTPITESEFLLLAKEFKQ